MSFAAPSPIDLIEALYDQHGFLAYGEQVNQIEHALQCASLAEQSGAGDELIVSALLHDVGHMLHRDAAQTLQAGSMSDARALDFEALPYAGDAVRLRRWDDGGKQPAARTPTLAHYLGIAQRCVRTR